jgi:opacity protein-like surface antigen
MRLATFLFFLLVSTSTYAGNLNLQGTVEPSTKFYVGAHGGFLTDSADTAGVVGVHTGIMFRSGSIWYGAEVDFSGTTLEDEASFLGVHVSTGLPWLTTIRGRLGTSVGPDLLFYGTTGIAFGAIETNVSTSFGNLEASDVITGFVVGAGVEYGISNPLSFRLEGQYLYFPEQDLEEHGLSEMPALDGFVFRAAASYALN